MGVDVRKDGIKNFMAHDYGLRVRAVLEQAFKFNEVKLKLPFF